MYAFSLVITVLSWQPKVLIDVILGACVKLISIFHSRQLFGLEFRVISSGSRRRWVAAVAAAAVTVAMAAAMAATVEERVITL